MVIQFAYAHELLDDKSYKYIKEFIEKTLNELLEIYRSTTGPQGQVKDRAKHFAVLAVIADRLELVSRTVLTDILTKELTGIFERLDELERLSKTHRHKTIYGLYTEKPSW